MQIGYFTLYSLEVKAQCGLNFFLLRQVKATVIKDLQTSIQNKNFHKVTVNALKCCYIIWLTSYENMLRTIIAYSEIG